MELPPLPRKDFIERCRAACRQRRLDYHFERWYPFGCAVIATLVVCYFQPTPKQATKIVDSVLPVVVSAAAILAGFQAAALSVLLGLLNSRTVRFLKVHGKLNLVVQYHQAAIQLLLLFFVAALGVLVWRAMTPGKGAVHDSLIAGLVFLLAWAGASNYRMGQVMLAILHKDAEPDDSSSPKPSVS